MGRINPLKFQRVVEAFHSDELRVCESSGSEHSPESSPDLSDLVNSFMEKNERSTKGGDAVVDVVRELEEFDWSESDYDNKREVLQQIFADDDNEYGCDDKDKIRREAEIVFGLVGKNPSSHGFKRLFMSRLRERGFDAGLCKSKWEKSRRFPGGDYEYIDVNFGGNRYIVDISLAAEFEIARPTNQYSSLLEVFPLIFVGKVEELKRVVKLMCTAMNESMKSMNLHIPPWRRNSYMQAKWFSSYKRTTNEVATKDSVFSTRKSIGFEARSVNSYNCKDEYYGRKSDFRVGHLTTAFNVDGLGV